MNFSSSVFFWDIDQHLLVANILQVLSVKINICHRIVVYTVHKYAVLSETFPMDEIQNIARCLDKAAYDYEIRKRETAVTVYNSELPDLVKTYLVCKKIEGLSEQTLYNYGNCLRIFFFEVQKAPEQVTANDIRVFLYRYQEVKKISNRTLDKYREYIGHFFGWACEEEYLDKDPAKAIKPIKYEVKPRQALSQIELEYLRRACVTLKEKAIVEVLYSTGCRVSELARLRKADIDWHEKSVHLFGKGNKHRISFLNAKAEVAIKEYLASRTDECPSLFVSDRRPHHALKKDALEKIVRNISRRATAKLDKKVTPHVLRHTTATTAIRNGMPVEDISKLLGHERIDTTMIYAKTSLANVQAGHKKYIV